VVIFRRWKISLPLLLLAIAGTAFVAATAKPEYTMTSYVQLIPARVAPTDNPTAASLRNPWNQLGVNTLGQASIYATQDQNFLDSLKASKHTANFTLTMDYPNPIITVEVVGSTPADVRETTELVTDRLRESAESLQRRSGVNDGDMMATQRLDQGQNLLPSRSKVKRAIFAVAVAGLIMTAGGTVGFDALARRRSRKRRKREQAESPPQESLETGTTNGEEILVPAELGEPMTRPTTVVPSAKYADQPVSPPWTAPPLSTEQTAILQRTPPPPRPPLAAASRRWLGPATYHSANAHSEAAAENYDRMPPGRNGYSIGAPSDFRVVLQPKWPGDENGGK
jgi:hypothetical protein